MRLLIVSTIPTHPVNAGNRSFILQQVHLLQGMGHEVFFLYVMNSRFSKNVVTIKELKKFWGDNIFIYTIPFWERRYFEIITSIRKRFNKGYYKCDDLYSTGLGKYVINLNKEKKFDGCIINYYWLSKLFLQFKIGKSAIFTHDYFSFKDLLVGKDGNTWMCTTPDEEAKGLQRCKTIFALNNEEAFFFSKLSPNSNVSCIYTTCPYVHQEFKGNKNMLFLSSSNIFNIEGLKWFLNEIFIFICKKHGDVRLLIGGGICETEFVQSLRQNEFINVCGKVDDVNAFYSKGDIVINPTYQGTGLKIKTLEGISYGKVVLAHPHSKTGLYRTDIAPIFSSVNAKEWVDYTSMLWEYPNLVLEIKNKDEEYLRMLRDNAIEQYNNYLYDLRQ